MHVLDGSSNHIIKRCFVCRQKQAMPCWFVIMTQYHQISVTPLQHRLQAKSHSPLPKLILLVMCLNHCNDHCIILAPIHHQNNVFLIPVILFTSWKSTSMRLDFHLCLYALWKIILEAPNWYTWQNTVSRTNVHSI